MDLPSSPHHLDTYPQRDGLTPIAEFGALAGAPSRTGASEHAPPSRRLADRLADLLAGPRHGTRDPDSASPLRDRTISLHWPRVLLLLGALTGLAALGASALLWVQLERAAHRDATRALRLVERRLVAIEAEMRQLAEQASTDAMWSACAPSLAAMLARASIASDHVQRFELSTDGYTSTCRPEGRSAAPLYEHVAGDRLSLTSSGEILSRPTATLRVDGQGHVVAAVLDARAFRPAPGAEDDRSFESASPLWLHAGDGAPLAVLNAEHAPSATAPWRRLQVRSSRREIAVTADLELAAYLARLQRWLPPLLLLSLACAAGLVALAWRRTLHRARLYHRIARGLRRREFEPFVQPIIDLRTGQCAGAEVLMRWAHPQRGLLGPAEFIEEAERTGLIAGMSDLVMTRAAHRLAPIAQQFPALYFSFNLTPQQLALPQLSMRLAEIFRADTLPRDRVLLELTEREFVDPLSLGSLHALQADGWRVAIDDFGTGHSSLATLEQLSIDRLKIDRAFVSAINDATVNRPVLDAIIQLAERLRLPIIAEGIETPAQWEYLKERGVQYAQGYLMGRPMPIAAFLEWLSGSATPGRIAAALPAGPSAEEAVPDAGAQQLWNAMRTPGGLDIRDRMYRLRTYPQCFVGREAVDWIVQHHQVSRADAVRMGRRLSALGLLSHVLQEHDFEDAELFYELATPRGASLVAGPAASGLRAALRNARGGLLQTHVRGVVRHRECATGDAIVRWIARTRQVSRDTATHWALQLMREGALRHVYDDAPFRDDRTLYRIV